MNHSIMRRRGTRWSLVALAATAALITSGCSSESTPAPAASDGAVEQTDITLVVAPVYNETAYIALKKGYFEDEGLNVTITTGGAAAANLAELVGGSADLSIVSWEVAVNAVAEGIPVKVVSAATVISDEVDTSGVVVRADSGIESLADLEGKTIAVQELGTANDIIISEALDLKGIDPDSVARVAIPYASQQTALETKQVDAAFMADADYARVAKDPAYRVIANPSRENRAGLPITMWAATSAWLDANPNTAKAFLAAMEKANEFYSDDANLDAVLQIRSEVSGTPIDEVSKTLVPVSLETPVDIAQRVTETAVKYGLIQTDTVPSVDDVLWSGAPRS